MTPGTGFDRHRAQIAGHGERAARTCRGSSDLGAIAPADLGAIRPAERSGRDLFRLLKRMTPGTAFDRHRAQIAGRGKRARTGRGSADLGAFAPIELGAIRSAVRSGRDFFRLLTRITPGTGFDRDRSQIAGRGERADRREGAWPGQPSMSLDMRWVVSIHSSTISKITSFVGRTRSRRPTIWPTGEPCISLTRERAMRVAAGW